MKSKHLERVLSELQKLGRQAGVEINIADGKVSLWTADRNDFTCQDVTPRDAIKAIKVIRKFRKHWVIE